jgi:hypothetical protein
MFAAILMGSLGIYAAYEIGKDMWQSFQRSRASFAEKWGDTEMPPGHPERDSEGLTGDERDAFQDLVTRTWGGQT